MNWTVLLSILIGAFFVGYSIASIIYYLQARDRALGNGHALSMVVVSVIMLIAAIFLIGWGIFVKSKTVAPVDYSPCRDVEITCEDPDSVECDLKKQQARETCVHKQQRRFVEDCEQYPNDERCVQYRATIAGLPRNAMRL